MKQHDIWDYDRSEDFNCSLLNFDAMWTLCDFKGFRGTCLLHIQGTRAITQRHKPEDRCRKYINKFVWDTVALLIRKEAVFCHQTVKQTHVKSRAYVYGFSSDFRLQTVEGNFEVFIAVTDKVKKKH